MSIFYLGILVYQAANLFDVTNRWSLSLNFIADISIPFSIFLRSYLIILAVGESLPCMKTVVQYILSHFRSLLSFVILFSIFFIRGGCFLLKHMWSLRAKKYGRTTRRRSNKAIKKE